MATKSAEAFPKKDFSLITQSGLKALNLGTMHKAALSPRLPAGTLDLLAIDLQKLGAVVPNAKATRAAAQVATATQGTALAEGYALVTAIRLAVQRSGAPSDVRKAYGVGATTSPRVVKSVKAAITQIVDRAINNTGEASALGILAKDVSALQDDLAAITSADDAQEQQRAGAPQTTKERNRTANRILGTIDRIAGAGAIEFAKQPEERAKFEALIAGAGGKKKPKKEPSPPKP
jgi:hypothetical protein